MKSDCNDHLKFSHCRHDAECQTPLNAYHVNLPDHVHTRASA